MNEGSAERRGPRTQSTASTRASRLHDRRVYRRFAESGTVVGDGPVDPIGPEVGGRFHSLVGGVVPVGIVVAVFARVRLVSRRRNFTIPGPYRRRMPRFRSNRGLSRPDPGTDAPIFDDGRTEPGRGTDGRRDHIQEGKFLDFGIHGEFLPSKKWKGRRI